MAVPDVRASTGSRDHERLPRANRSLTRRDVLTAADVAELLRIPVSTVYDLARRGLLPAHRVGRAWRFLRHEIEARLLAN